MDTTALAERLLPCPFCGGEARLVEVEPSGYVVECTNGACGASTNIIFSCGEDSRPLVAKQWNRRAVAGEPVAYISQQTIEILNKCRNDTHNGTANVWMRPEENGYAANIPLYTRPQPATPASDGDGESALWALRQILHDLPIRRDWLDPDVERVARGLVERSPFADLTTPNPEQPGADR